MTTSRTPRAAGAIAATIAVLLSITTSASTLRAGFTETTIVSGLVRPTAMAFAPDGRLFVCQQDGELRVINAAGALLPTPFLTVDVNAFGERGLLGVAFDPTFETAPAGQKYIYVYYTATTPTIHNRVSRFTADSNNPDVAAANSEMSLLDLNTLSGATNHNGGAMHFGPDGKLYIAVGDNANRDNAQLFTNLLGKILRINKDGSIPGDNPFVSQTTGDNEAIWALGLRNPFTFSFDPDDGRMFINDVGENTWEEVNLGVPGGNYGWPATEGPTMDPRYESPLFSYQHNSGSPTGCAITGGAFYRGGTQPFPGEYMGEYFFDDYCGGWINQLHHVPNPQVVTLVTPTFATGVTQFPVDLAVGPDGALYYLARGSEATAGAVQRIAFGGPQAPTIQTHPQNRSVSVGQTATFSVTATGSTPLSYQWLKNGVNIPGATASSYTTPPVTAADSGAAFRCVVTNAVDSVTSNAGILTVTANQAPGATILTPVASTLYSAGTTLNFSGNATDPEDGTLPGARFTWRIDFHHDTHTHPGMAPTSGITSGSFAIPNNNEIATNVFYRIVLTVTDSAGQAVTVMRDVQPRIVNVTLQTNPPGLSLGLDGGAPRATPFTFPGVAGVLRLVDAPTPQTLGGLNYDFKSWPDRGAQNHLLVTPSVTSTVTATYKRNRR